MLFELQMSLEIKMDGNIIMNFGIVTIFLEAIMAYFRILQQYSSADKSYTSFEVWD
jgi:hypothetical protein